MTSSTCDNPQNKKALACGPWPNTFNDGPPNMGDPGGQWFKPDLGHKSVNQAIIFGRAGFLLGCGRG